MISAPELAPETLTAIIFLAVLAAVLMLEVSVLVIRPAWLVGPRARPESVAVQAASTMATFLLVGKA